jgi:hypothetical protein
MTVLGLILLLLLAGVGLYYLNLPTTPVSRGMKILINVLVLGLAIIVLLNVFGVFPALGLGDLNRRVR